MDIDWERKYLLGEITLHECILQYMLEGRVIPHWVTDSFHKAINDYQQGGDFIKSMGLDALYLKSDAKRSIKSRLINEKVHIESLVKVASDLGLPITKNKNQEQPHGNELFERLKVNFMAYTKRPITKKTETELRFTSAFGFVGLIVNKSESAVEKIYYR